MNFTISKPEITTLIIMVIIDGLQSLCRMNVLERIIREMVDQSDSLFGEFALRSQREGESCRRSQVRYSQSQRGYEELSKSQNYKETNSDSERKPVGKRKNIREK